MHDFHVPEPQSLDSEPHSRYMTTMYRHFCRYIQKLNIFEPILKAKFSSRYIPKHTI